MSTNVEEFRLFHQLLTAARPDYQPFYFVLRPGGKEPLGERGPWKDAGVTFEEACQWMKTGYNVAIAGTEHDPLVIIDVDKEGVVDDVKPTLCVRTRKRTGHHYFYFTSDPRCKVNVPSAEHVGELRSLWQYVVAAGSFVRTDPKKLEVQPPEEQIPALGAYTVEKDLPVASITYDELPLVFRKTIAEQGTLQQTKREPRKWEREGPQSKIWSLSIEAVIGEHPANNFPSPFHGSETGANTTVSNGLLHCWRHNVSMTPLQALAVKSGILDCMAAGDGHAGSGVGPSVIDFRDRDFVLRLWDYAKRAKIVPENDLHPLGDDQPKKGRKKKGEKEEEPKYAAFRQFANVIYRQCVKDGVCRFARYDRITKQLSYVDKVMETGEVPVPYETAIIATFPRELRPYGTPAALYRELKQRFKFASDQTGHKNHIVVLYLMETGCSPPWKRKNFQLILIGLPASGKGRFIDMCKALGDRARKMTMPKEATNQRLNDLFGGGLEIIDEMRDDDEELEAYIRSRYDPGTVNPRLLDPFSKTNIVGFSVAGPTVITRRRPFLDDANTDRGIVIWCEQGEEFPLEILDDSTERNLQDKLAMFWTEYYDDERLLPTQEELMYNKKLDDIDPRLKLATIYIMKLATLIGDEAIADLEGFIQEQQRLRRELKANTAEGSCVRAIWDIIQENVGGRTYTYENKNGTKTKVCDTLSHDVLKGKTAIYLTRAPADGGADNESKLAPINLSMIAKMAGLGPQEPRKLLEVHLVSDGWAGPKGNRVRCVTFDIEKLDTAFKSFLPEYDPDWKKIFKNDGTQSQLPSENPLPPQNTPTELPPSVTPRAPATPRYVEPDETLSKDVIDAQIANLQTCVVVDQDEDKRALEVESLDWIIRKVVDAHMNSDRTGPHLLRIEACRTFKDWQLERTVQIVDSFFAEVDRVSDLIYRKKKEVEHVSKS